MYRDPLIPAQQAGVKIIQLAQQLCGCHLWQHCVSGRKDNSGLLLLFCPPCFKPTRTGFALSEMLILVASAPRIVLSPAAQSSCLCMSNTSPKGICKGKQAAPSRKVTNNLNSAAFYTNYGDLIPIVPPPVAQSVWDIVEFSLGFTAAQ